MKKLIPQRAELSMFGAVALVFSIIATSMPAAEVGLAILSVPLFITATFLGMRRSGQWAYIQSKSEEQETEV